MNKKTISKHTKMTAQLFGGAGAPNQPNGPGRMVRLADDQISDLTNGETQVRMAEALERIAIAQAQSIDVTSFPQIQELVRQGRHKDYFQIGDQINVTWEAAANTEYDMPWDVVDFGPCEDENGVIHENAMWLQSHYALPGVQFSGNNAFYVPTAEMAPGTYHFTLANNWGTNCVAGKSYQFTTTQKVPAHGQLVLGTATSNTSGLPDTAPANWRVRTYANGAQTTPTEILELTEGTDGTDLGSLSSSTKYADSGINNMQRSAYGYNRWSVSAMRQWLNSAAEAEQWWVQKYPHDHRPDQLASMRGFVAGLPADFLAIVKPIKVVTALNTVSDADIGTSETTYDRFFLASLQQEFCAPQWTGEGEAWEYWQERLNNQIHAQWDTRAEHIRYSISNHSSAQHVRLRSANRGNANSTWLVNTSGNCHTNDATNANAPAPACVIY